jgi:hypothetical protein
MEIQKENIIAAYETATENQRTLLQALFPDLLLGQAEKQTDDRPVTERIKTFMDACDEVGRDSHLYYAYTIAQALWENHENSYDDADLLAFAKLRIIVAALNEGWIPTIGRDKFVWYPYFRLSEFITDDSASRLTIGYATEHDGFGYAFSLSDTSDPYYVHHNLRLCLKSEDLANYCARQFADIWQDYLLIRKPQPEV